MVENNYIPCVCNIGREEIRKRNIIGIIGLILTVVVLFLSKYFNATFSFKLITIIPAVFSSFGFLQARAHFCIYYGWASLFNFDSFGKKTKVKKDIYIILDKKKSLRILLFSLLIGLTIGIAAIII